MKFIFVFILLLFSFNSLSATQKTLTILSWDNFFPQSVLEEFEKRKNIRIRVISYYNDEMKDYLFKDMNYNTIDLVVSSSNGIMDYTQNNRIIEIKQDKLKNYKNLDTSYATDFTYSHSLPISYGAMGIIYRKDLISEKNKPISIKELFEPKKIYQKKIFLPDDPEEVIDLFLLSQKDIKENYTIKELKEAAFSLQNMKPYIITYQYKNDNAISLLTSGKAYIGFAYGFEIFRNISEYKNLDFYYPQEGAKIWVDNIAISSSSKKMELAYEFLDFILEPKIAADISNHNLYATFNKLSIPYIEHKLKNNILIYPHLNGYKLLVDKNKSSYLLGKKFFFYQNILKN